MLKSATDVARKIYGMLMDNNTEWWLDRGKTGWARATIGRPTECGRCGGTISSGEIGEFFFIEIGLRKFCIDVFCLSCSHSLKRNNALVNALYETHNGVMRNVGVDRKT